jgi:transposase
MPHPLSNDLRKRVVGFVEAGHSRHEAAAHFGTSVSFAVNLMTLWRETGSVEPRPRGGFRHGKLGPHKDFILAAVAARSDITMPELADALEKAKGVKVHPATLSKFLIACGLSVKKNPSRKRTRQARTGQSAGGLERRPPAHHA